MSEDNEPDRAAELAKASEILVRQMAPAIQASEILVRQMAPAIQASGMLARQMEPAMQAHERWRRQFEPMIQAHERLRRQMEPIVRAHEAMRRQAEQIFRGHEALRRQAEQIAKATELFARYAEWPKINVGPVLPYPLWLANATDGQMRELLSPRPSAHQRSAAPNVNVAMTATAEVAAAGGLAPSPTVVGADGDVATASENGSAEELDSRRRGLAGLNDGQILTSVLIWLIVLAIPAAAWDANLPTEIQALVDVYDGVLANVAVAITFDILGKRKKR